MPDERSHHGRAVHAVPCCPFAVPPWRSGRHLSGLLALGIITLVFAASAHAATYTVSNTADTGPGSLRNAITSVNGDQSADAIIFQPGLTGTITPLTPLPSFVNSVSITGPGALVLTISGATAGASILTVNSGAVVSISGLTISGATLSLSAPSGVDGGAINSAGTLTVSNCAISGNSASAGGGIYVSAGTLTVLDSTFSGNSASGEGGAIDLVNSATATVTNSTFSGNTAQGGNGGAINSPSATLSITNSTISLNTATVGQGGGVFSAGTLTLANSIVAGNSATANPSTNDLAETGKYNNNGGNQVDETGAAIALAPLGNYGGSLGTMLPLPGSPAICGGSQGLAKDPSGAALTTDERGFNFAQSTYCTGGTVDVGAVQTDYTSIQFTNQNSTYGFVGVTGQAVATPAAPNISVTENTQNIGGVPVTLTEGSGTATGVGPVTTTGGSGATFGDLAVATADANDTLSASLQIVSGSTLSTGNVGLVIESPITASSGALPGANVGALYTEPVVSGGTPPYTLTDGTPPSGFVFGTNGTLSGTPTNIANYTFGLTIQDNYGFSTSGSYTLAVTKGSATVNFSGLNQTYTGSSLFVTATTTPAGLTVNLTYAGTGNTAYAQSSTPPTDAGTYTVNATVSDENYSGSASTTFTIAKATANVAISNLNQVYTGAPLPVTVGSTPSNLAVVATYSGNGYGPSTTPPMNAGTYVVNATVNDPNYSGTASGQFQIAKANATVSLSNLLQPYTGAPLSVTATTVPAGLQVAITYNGSATLPINGGTYSVIATINDPNHLGSTTGQLLIEDFSLSASSTGAISVTQGFASASGVSGVDPDPFTAQSITITPSAVAGYTPNLTLTCTVSASVAPSSPTTPGCLLNDSQTSTTDSGLAPVSLAVDASKATPGLYALTLTAVDPVTLLSSTSVFAVTVRGTSSVVTLQSGATTGNSATVNFVLPANVSLSGMSCPLIAGPTLSAPITPTALSVACSLTPSSIASSSSIQNAAVTVTVSTGETTSANLQYKSTYLAAAMFGIPLLGLLGIMRRGRGFGTTIFRAFLILSIVIGTFQLTGCGGSFTRPPTLTGATPPGSYSLLVQGTGSDNQSYQAVLELNVTR
jgi:predicted outer membrane repeat protein